MALYAFDGTWNKDDEVDSNEYDEHTNVVKFRDYYGQQHGNDKINYLPGVGTRGGVIGKFAGGVSGAGGKERIREMYDALETNWVNGDKDIDIIGFSRGAALAVHFANKIADEGVNGQTVTIRFLGVWDIVGSFGIPIDIGDIPAHDINPGLIIDRVPECVQHCFHAMALDERRQAFDVTRLKNADGDRVQECWFRGVHSDVGGGNGNVDLSNIALQWMMEKAHESGLSIPKSDINAINPINPTVDIGKNFDPIKNDRRTVRATDVFHPTAVKRLAMGEKASFPVYAREKYNWSGILMEQGAQYRFEVADDQKWKDGDIICGADGWKTEGLNKVKEALFELFHLEEKRRYPKANWFELMGSLGSDGSHYFRIGKTATYTAPQDGGLFTFANDLNAMYVNNKGEIEVTVERVN